MVPNELVQWLTYRQTAFRRASRYETVLRFKGLRFADMIFQKLTDTMNLGFVVGERLWSLRSAVRASNPAMTLPDTPVNQ